MIPEDEHPISFIGPVSAPTIPPELVVILLLDEQLIMKLFSVFFPKYCCPIHPPYSVRVVPLMVFISML